MTATATKILKPEVKNPLIHQKINTNPVNKDSIEGITRETDRMVTGTFTNVECPGQPAKISGKYYPKMEYFTKTFMDGEKCSIPLSVARWINERAQYEEHSYLQDEKGQAIKTGKWKARYKFIAEF